MLLSLFRAATCGLAFICFAAAADGLLPPLKEVPQLIRNGKLDDAERIVDGILAANPKYPAARFQKSILLTERGRIDEAIAVLQELSGDYPELPEPYNNLAVLYAAKGRYDDALWALIAARKAEPNYALADENLGDVYVKLANLAYEEAAKLDASNQALRSKRDALRGLIAPPKASVSMSTPRATDPASR